MMSNNFGPIVSKNMCLSRKIDTIIEKMTLRYRNESQNRSRTFKEFLK